MLHPIKTQAIRKIVNSYFKNSRGEPFPITDGQCELFEAATNPAYRWVWDSAPTRYGKSEILAMALIYLAVFHNLKIPIVAGSADKAEKIMEYVVQHLGDNPELYRGLINIKDFSSIDRLKITVSKDTLKWSSGGWIYITSVDSRNISKEGESVVGEGGDIVVLEEAGLIRHKEQFSKIVRMPEDDKQWGKLIMSGNCVEGSVFETAFTDPKFHKVRITLEQALAEGRFSDDYIQEKRSMTTSKDWKRYYLVEFPEKGEYAYFKPRKYEYLPTGLQYYGAIDLALGESTKGSLTAINICAKDTNNQAYQVQTIGEIMKPDEAIRTILNLPYTFTRFGVEAVQFQRYFLSVIKTKSQEEGKHIPFVGVEQKRKKEERIESIEPAISTGQILFKGDDILWDHMQDYPNIDKLDVLDSLEMCLRLMGIVGYDPKTDTSRIVI